MDWVLASDANTLGEQSGGDMGRAGGEGATFLPCVLVRWLAAGGGSAAQLEAHLHEKWLASALGGPRQGELLDERARGELARFPEELRMNTGLVVTAMPAGAPLG